MPSYDRLRPHDCHHIKNGRREPIQQYKDKPIERFEGRALGVLRRSTFNWWRSAITSPSSELLDRKRSRRIQLSRLKGSSTRRSSRNSGAQAKRMEFAVGTGWNDNGYGVGIALFLHVRAEWRGFRSHHRHLRVIMPSLRC